MDGTQITCTGTCKHHQSTNIKLNAQLKINGDDDININDLVKKLYSSNFMDS